jgi:hypothetical protein
MERLSYFPSFLSFFFLLFKNYYCFILPLLEAEVYRKGNQIKHIKIHTLTHDVNVFVQKNTPLRCSLSLGEGQG